MLALAVVLVLTLVFLRSIWCDVRVDFRAIRSIALVGWNSETYTMPVKQMIIDREGVSQIVSNLQSGFWFNRWWGPYCDVMDVIGPTYLCLDAQSNALACITFHPTRGVMELSQDVVRTNGTYTIAIDPDREHKPRPVKYYWQTNLHVPLPPAAPTHLQAP